MPVPHHVAVNLLSGRPCSACETHGQEATIVQHPSEGGALGRKSFRLAVSQMRQREQSANDTGCLPACETRDT